MTCLRWLMCSEIYCVVVVLLYRWNPCCSFAIICFHVKVYRAFDRIDHRILAKTLSVINLSKSLGMVTPTRPHTDTSVIPYFICGALYWNRSDEWFFLISCYVPSPVANTALKMFSSIGEMLSTLFLSVIVYNHHFYPVFFWLLSIYNYTLHACMSIEVLCLELLFIK